MKKYFSNLGYFIKEVKTLVSMNMLSNTITLLSTALILFILSMVISAWWISGGVMEAIRDEAEVNVYYRENLTDAELSVLMKEIEAIEGVWESKHIEVDEAYERMETILGKEARVLEHFDNNPFSSFIEIGIRLESMDSILKELKTLDGIEHIRDNRQVLKRLQNISEISKFLGYLVIMAASITTIVIISHIIRLGIYNNKEQITTLRLLGAPRAFIAFPFLLGGLFLTLGGGIIASFLSSFILRNIYVQVEGPLPFIPLPPVTVLLNNISLLIIIVSGILGILGSLFGLLSIKDE